jgi:peroxiredoxin
MSSEPTTVDREEETAGLSIAIGAAIPSIGLRASDGYLLNLRSFVSRQPVACLFFAAPTAEGAQRRRGTQVAEALAAGRRRLASAGIAVVGVTCDNEAQQAAWISETGFPYLLFSDERRTAVSLLGIPLSHDGANHNVERPWILVVGADGLLKAALRDPEPEYAADLVLAAVRRAEGGDADEGPDVEAEPTAGAEPDDAASGSSAGSPHPPSA